MEDPWRERLSDYLDGELTEEAEAECRRHLGSCPACRNDLAGIERVKRWACQHLAKQPDVDAWPAIQRAIEALGPSSKSLPAGSSSKIAGGRLAVRKRFLAAAVVLLAALALVWRFLPAPPDRHSGQTTSATATADARALAAAAEELAQELKPLETALDSETLGDLEESLAMLETFSAEVADRLEEEPENELLREFLIRSWRMKLQVLRHAASNALNRS